MPDWITAAENADLDRQYMEMKYAEQVSAELKTLLAENERLRKALEEIAKDDGDYPPYARIARAALDHSPDARKVEEENRG